MFGLVLTCSNICDTGEQFKGMLIFLLNFQLKSTWTIVEEERVIIPLSFFQAYTQLFFHVRNIFSNSLREVIPFCNYSHRHYVVGTPDVPTVTSTADYSEDCNSLSKQHTYTLLLGIYCRRQDTQYTRSYCSPQLSKQHLFSHTHTKTSTRGTPESSKFLREVK